MLGLAEFPCLVRQRLPDTGCEAPERPRERCKSSRLQWVLTIERKLSKATGATAHPVVRVKKTRKSGWGLRAPHLQP